MRLALLRPALAVAGPLVALDLLSKWYMFAHVVPDQGTILTITGFFNLRRVWNTGVSFGLFGGGTPAWLLVLLALAIAGLLVYWLLTARTRRAALAIGAVLGGAIGNVWDRIAFGAVRDFLDFHAFGYHWPAFNLADAAITLGVIALLIDSLFDRREAAT
jgi:signal peptidase II